MNTITVNKNIETLNLNNYKILGQKGVLIRLLPYRSETTTTAEGIIIPLYENYETEGGRPASRIKSEDKYSTIGEVLQISDKAQLILNEEKMDIKVGDYISIPLVHKHPSNQFLLSKNDSVSEFEGYLTIYPNMVQAKIIINSEE